MGIAQDYGQIGALMQKTRGGGRGRGGRNAPPPYLATQEAPELQVGLKSLLWPSTEKVTRSRVEVGGLEGGGKGGGLCATPLRTPPSHDPGQTRLWDPGAG